VSTLVLVVGLVCGGMTMYMGAMIGVMRRRSKCPACGAKKLALVQVTRGLEWPPQGRPLDLAMFRCEGCGARFGRQGNGSLIPKEAWDAGMRDGIPKATIVPPSKDR
jgi:hypothetical protein